MQKSLAIVAILIFTALTARPLPAHAGEAQHDGTMQMPHGMKRGMHGMFLTQKEIDGYAVTFHVMKAKAGTPINSAYHFMIKVEKEGKAVTHLIVNSKVNHPDGHSESKMMMKMGDWYMAGYNLAHKGRHALMVLFMTPDGKKHFGGVYYPAQ